MLPHLERAMLVVADRHGCGVYNGVGFALTATAVGIVMTLATQRFGGLLIGAIGVALLVAARQRRAQDLSGDRSAG